MCKDDTPTITVALPTYMAERTVAQAVASVLSQTMGDFELIVIDDGSTDATADLVRGFDDARIRLVTDGQHLGIAARLNQMVSLARGQYFARMDADDLMLPQRLQRQLEFMRQHPEADVVGSSAIVIDAEGRTVGRRGSQQPEAGYERVWRLMHPTLMGRTAWFLANRYNEAYSGCEDYELWMRVRGKATLLRMCEPLLCYRERMRYDIRRCWRERWVGLKMIWQERSLYGSTWRALAQMGYNVVVMAVVPLVHVLRLDAWVISRRNQSCEC